ncbi:hypothetical protein [Methylosinus sp. RM1]|uniref:hypothetical protein n=1 Tax=Methylosinus sp. RM1 TaxID=2583817 RepID=UPI0014082FBE|nr:hypothetical protein [Methylosinus sp. RM1]
MATSEESGDLFRPASAQGDLFADQPGPNTGVFTPDPAQVRARLHALLAKVRAAQAKSPWGDRETRMNRTIFPQMANWLPEDEAEQLRCAFRIELERLGLDKL